MEMESAEADNGISYDKAAEYWSDIPPTIDGMLGGFAKISGTDIDGSSKFLKGLFRLDDAPGNARCLDCGAGIGRISKHLLHRRPRRAEPQVSRAGEEIPRRGQRKRRHEDWPTHLLWAARLHPERRGLRCNLVPVGLGTSHRRGPGGFLQAGKGWAQPQGSNRCQGERDEYRRGGEGRGR